MNGRVWGAVAVGVLLALPLVGLLWTSVSPQRAGTWRRLPMISPDERLARPSFLEACASSAECDPPLACFSDRRYDRQTCNGSDCLIDADCALGSVCRWNPVGDGTKTAIASCTFVGVREEGESCLRLPRRDEGACERGLVCADWCARRCGLWPFNSCPEGYFCAEDDPNGPVCLPTCEGRVCPEGEQCVREATPGVSVCARVHGPNCQREPCAEGLTCKVDTSPVRPGEAWMECVTPCTGEGSFASPCPGFSACLFGTCHDICSLGEEDPCAPDYICVPMHGDSGVCAWAPQLPEPVDAPRGK
ncbi:hypothetical protein CYFUS_008975 [Cystobacter fuscus]|uniref:Uncharacterized protein n=1 Tax=Cystobacter fuscus TaxID=43 RepID=A0A250JHY0_9BACT|nr:hypothetical protein [Cystobacter fuscus]ATB43495.1 hypothetical protein CYFUS_008975 [Cystobacter fuscus]